MSDNIFATYAPIYWAHGISVIPLRERHKAPCIDQWSTYCSQLPSQALQNHWLATFPRGNIGIALGAASNLCIIDIDTDDEDLIAKIIAALPPSPWKRVGKKGMALAYRFNQQKNFKLRGADGNMLCEFLGSGNQVVTAPSIHPDTGLPYEVNCNLWEVLDQLNELPADIEVKLRETLGAAGVSLGAGGRSAPLDIVAAGDRDNQVVRHAGYLARVVLGIDKSQTLTLVEALAHMYAWVEGFTAKVSGDAMDPNKGVAKLLEFLAKDVEKGRTLPNGWDVGLDFEHPTIDFLRERNEQQRWTLSRAIGWLTEKVAEDPDNLDYVVERVFELIVLVSKDDKFSESMMRLLAEKIPTIIGMKIKKSDLVKAFTDARREGDSDALEDQEAIARGVLEEMARTGEVRHHLGSFWQWTGSCWTKIKEGDIYNLIATSVKGSMLARRHGDYTSILQVMAHIAAADIVTSEENGINFANGFVGEDLILVDHDPKYGATFTLPFEYNREKATQGYRWFAFLDSCWGEEEDYVERMMALQEMFAATLFKIAPRYQKAFLLFGRAGTGKTVMLRVLRSLLPPSAVCELGPEKWGERFSLTALVGKAVNICGELPESGLVPGAMFKRVIEADPITTEYKGRNQFSFVPDVGHWFASNYLPITRDSSNGFTRRWQILDFNRVVPKSEIVVDLADQIVAEEREAIVAWALEGLRRLIENEGYTEAKCHVRRVREMRRANNSVQAFLEDDHKYGKGDGEVKARPVYDKYVFHMREVGRGSPVTFERFMQMIEELGYEKSRDELGDYVVKGLVES